MSERPILFSAAMMRALLAGTKTQTRRVVKWPEWVTDQDDAVRGLNAGLRVGLFRDGLPKKIFTSPYGQPGDKVRLIGNSVCPEVAEAVVRANAPARQRRAA